MKFIFTALLAFTIGHSYGLTGPRAYYVSLGGDDANNGLSAAGAWKTIAKVNASFSIFNAGDSILFRQGDVFYGALIIGRSSILVSSFGAGVKPIISGFTPLTGWVNSSGNIWQATPSQSLKGLVNIVTVNGIAQEAGRTSYTPYTSATSTTITAPGITSADIGKIFYIRLNAYILQPARIVSVSGTTATFTQAYQPLDPAAQSSYGAYTASSGAGYSYFTKSFLGSLTTQGQWYFDSSANTMNLYSIIDPNLSTIMASRVDTVIYCAGYSNLTIQNIAVEGAGRYAIFSRGGTNFTVNNCDLNNNTAGIMSYQTGNTIITNNNINNSFSNAIFVRSTGGAPNVAVNNNKVTNTGQLLANGMFYFDADLKAIYVTGKSDSSTANHTNILDNTITNTGFAGIVFQGSNVHIQHNYINAYSNNLGDNGGIYTFNTHSVLNAPITYFNRVVEDNIVLNSNGAPDGAPGPDVGGLYADDQSPNIIWRNNTAANITGVGMQLNNPINQTWLNNTIYNCDPVVAISKKWFSEIYGTSVKHNILYQKTSAQMAYFHVNSDTTSPSLMTITTSLRLVTIDSNYVSNLNPSGYGYYYSGNRVKYTFPPPFTQAVWKANYLHDVNSIGPATAYTGANSTLYANPSYIPMPVLFPGLRKIDPTGTTYDNTAMVAPWQSLILIDDGTPCVDCLTTNYLPNYKKISGKENGK